MLKRTAHYMSSGVIAVLASAFILAASAGIAMAMERTQGYEDMLSGKITAVDASHATKSITMRSWSTGEPVMNIFVTNKTDVQMCKTENPLKDVKVGTEAQVSYHELAGLAVADLIKTPCS